MSELDLAQVCPARDVAPKYAWAIEVVRSLHKAHCIAQKGADTQIHVLMNNAGISRPCPAFSLSSSLSDLQDNWHAVLNTNFFGILNVAQAFAPYMARQENASVIINTGSKQGITCPPYVPALEVARV